MLEELVITAAVGTARKPPALPAGIAALDEAFATLAGASSEARLLGAVAILSRYESAGRLPAQASATLEPAADETRLACSRRAADLLAQVVAMTNTPAKEQLAAEWLGACSRQAQRVPHRLLPALLDYGASRRDVRKPIADVCGNRGAWLMRLNPRWRYEVGQADDPSSVWSTGTRDQRMGVIGELQRADPERLRELIRSTWKEDSAEDRALFLGTLCTSLQIEDEPFLESVLDDRSKNVRAMAAHLLALLPSSAYVRRMIERAESFLKLIPAGRTGLLRKLAPASLEVTLPPDQLDPSWARDGISEKPSAQMGRRQWFLRELLARIPPSHWSTAWSLTPLQCIDANHGEFADVVLAGWLNAAGMNRDPAWSAALLRASAIEGRGYLRHDLLEGLPDELRNTLTAEILNSPRTTIQTISQVLRIDKFPLNRQLGTTLIKKLENELTTEPNTYLHFFVQTLQDAALRLPPDMYDGLVERWTGERWTQVRKALDEFFATLLIRRNIQREFDT